MTVAELMARVAEALEEPDAATCKAKIGEIIEDGCVALAREQRAKRAEQMTVPDLLMS